MHQSLITGKTKVLRGELVLRRAWVDSIRMLEWEDNPGPQKDLNKATEVTFSTDEDWLHLVRERRTIFGDGSIMKAKHLPYSNPEHPGL